MNEKSSAILQRFLREPLLHFIVIGGLFFLLYSASGDSYEGSTDTISITPERIDQIATMFSGVWNRMPTEKELDNLIQEEIRSEVYYRDALALGLDKNDAIVRRRLRQKMEFLTDTGVYLKDPSAEELASFFAANSQAYRTEPRLAFEQIYFGESPPEETVVHALEALLSKPGLDRSTLGERTLLPEQLKLSPPDAIDSVFGKGFYRRIAWLPPGEWGGPVTSVYGKHLIRTLDGQPARIPPLEEIRDSVTKDWKSAKAKENREQDYTERRSRYKIEILRREDADVVADKGNP